ncbi:hypothetical protein [Oleiharenicola sp. Vm1]|uniref:hypothetical protein n=1 Tax=Oleiharenicola sp. Vm1 TaxID=3398393 RepID=UPI0039F554EC
MTPKLLKEIERLQKLPDGAVVFEVGVALQYFDAPPGVRYSAPYVEMGTELWATACYELQSLLCDKSERAPKDWVDELQAFYQTVQAGYFSAEEKALERQRELVRMESELAALKAQYRDEKKETADAHKKEIAELTATYRAEIARLTKPRREIRVIRS